VQTKPFKPPKPTNSSTASSSSSTSSSGSTTSASGGTGSDGGSSPADPAKKLSWIEIELIGEDKKPIPGEAYRITLPDNTIAEGTLDEKGFARVEGFEAGACKVTFPDLDQDAWEDA